MKDIFLKRYHLTLETIGPVFIGSGQLARKKEWILDRNRQEGIFLDDHKLFTYLKKHNLLDSYNEFMLKDKRKLIQWAYDAGLMPKNIKEVEKYRLDCSGVSKESTDKDILLFIKDGYGKPYIPGSSVKGALRTVLLAKMVRDYPKNVSGLVNEINHPTKRGKNYLKYDADKLNVEYFHKETRTDTRNSDVVNDMLRGLRISDSNSLDFSSMTVCQKIDVNTEGEEASLSIVRECIKPETKLSFELTIDTSEITITPEYILQAVGEFLQDYNRLFLSKFATEDLYTGNILYLGGGVGYESKTVTSQLLQSSGNQVELTSKIIDNTLSKKIQSQHKHYRDKTLGVSPHVAKITYYDNQYYQFGPCRISIDSF